MNIETSKALFIATPRSINGAKGGVRICTDEAQSVLHKAGFDLTIFPLDDDRRPLTRLRRKLFPRPYHDLHPPSAAHEAIKAIESLDAKFVFFNMVNTAPFSEPIKKALKNQVTTVLISHGLESVDYLHTLRLNNEISSIFKTGRVRRKLLADQLCEEYSQRRYIDHVFCLAPFEAEIERWLGAKAVTWLPRTINSRPIAWTPCPGRAGFVGCIDHPPNAEGLFLLGQALKALAAPPGTLRVVGGPRDAGRKLARRFACIEYLGPLPDAELEKEAGTWCCFVNPLFCFARGCSTKLAIGLGWGIPIVTTPAGCRGYTWDSGSLAVVETPEAMARVIQDMTRIEVATAARVEAQRVANSCPSEADVAAKVRSALNPTVVIDKHAAWLAG